MDFGRVEFSKLDQIDFSPPKEPAINREVLARTPKEKPTSFYVGLSRWGRKEFIGKLFPKGTKDRGFSSEYMKHFNAIEFNATHYKLYSQNHINAWVAQAPEYFKFCPKFYQGISHFGTLNDKQFLTDSFLQSMRAFGKNLGPIFLQLSDKFGPKRQEELSQYLKKLPRDLQFFFELRHPDWFQERIDQQMLELLQHLGIGLVITDTAGRRDVAHMNLTIPKAFIRFIGNNLHGTDYKRIDEWIQRIKFWGEQGLQELYFFVHVLDEALSLELSQYVIHQLKVHCGADGLKEISFID